MKKYFSFWIFLLPFLANAQETGIHFEHELNWQQILAKSKEENKLIFIDCYTTWCGPCKYMSKTVFTDSITGAFFNKHFINLKLQLDTTSNDNDEVKAWYAIGNQFIKTYNIAYYPTFLFFNSDGKIVHRIVGAADADKFIVKASKAIDPQTQYYSLLGKYHEGEKSEKSLYNLALSCLDAYDLETADKVADEYFNTQKNLYTNDNLALLQSVTTHSGDRGFNMMLNNPDEIDAILGKATSASITRDIIVQEEVAPFLDDAMTNGLIPDWQLLLAKVKLKYDERANEIVTYSRMLFYKQTGTIDSLLNSIQFYFKNYAGYLKPDLANSLAWEVFQSGTDSTLLNETANFCRVILNQNQNAMFMDTYANLLYKLGNIDDAILWEQKAVDLSEGAINGLLENLDKMKRGEKTWQD